MTMAQRVKQGWSKTVKFSDLGTKKTQNPDNLQGNRQHGEQTTQKHASTNQQNTKKNTNPTTPHHQQQEGNIHISPPYSTTPSDPRHSRGPSSLSSDISSSNPSDIIDKAIKNKSPPPKLIDKWKVKKLNRLGGFSKKPATRQSPNDLKQKVEAMEPKKLSNLDLTKKRALLAFMKPSSNPLKFPVIKTTSGEAMIGNKRKFSFEGGSIQNNPAEPVTSPSPSLEKLYGLGGSSETQLLNAGIVSVLERLNKQKMNRLQDDVMTELQDIRKRVNQALRNVDYMFDDHNDIDEFDHNKFRPESIPRRSEEDRKTEIIELIKGMMEGIDIQHGLLEDVQEWFEEAQDMGLNEEMDPEFTDYVLSTDNTVAEDLNSLEEFCMASKKMMELGGTVINEAGKIIKENAAQAKKIKVGRDRVIVYDEKECYIDTLKWEKAVRLILNTFDDALKWTKIAACKNLYTKTKKQFQNLISAMNKKILDLKSKQREVEDLKKKILDTKISTENNNLECEEMKKSMRKMTRETEERTKSMEALDKRVNDLSKKLFMEEQKVKALEDELIEKDAALKLEIKQKDNALKRETKQKDKVLKREMNQKDTPQTVAQTAPPPVAPPNPPNVKKEKIVDPDTVKKLKDTEDQLKTSNNTITKLTEKIKDYEKQLMNEKEKIHTLKEELERAEKEAEEAAMSVSIPEPTFELPEIQETGDKDSAYYKKLLSGLKKDFSQELDKLKDHLKKERQRSTAAVKRNDMVYKDQLNAIQKDVVRVLRAIMHFRDHIAAVMEKDNLKELVYSIKKLGSLVPEKLSPDPRDLLSLLVANVVEYMHNMEVIIANAFLSMRMMIKGTVQAELKDAQTKLKTIDTVKTEAGSRATKLKAVKDELDEFQSKDSRYHNLLDRYQMMQKMFSQLEKDMDVLQGDFQSRVEEKIKESEQIVMTNIKLDMKQRKAAHELELKMTIDEQRENLYLLERAYEENKISKELYMMSSNMLQKTLSIPGKRFKYLCEQYIAFRSVKDAKARILRILEDPELELDVRQDLESYTRRMENKMHANMGLWHERMRALEDERKKMYQSMWKLFNDVLVESGVLLVHPLFQKDKEARQKYGQIAKMIQREAFKKIMKKHRGAEQLMKLPPLLVGRNMVSRSPVKSDTWNQMGQGDRHSSRAMVDTPHTLYYDVNRPRIAAKKVIQYKDKSRSAYPLAKIQNYAIN